MTGSSPRVRGRHRLSFFPAGAARLIPACAGQTQAFSMGKGSRWAHPRVCGADSPTRARLAQPARAHPRVCGADGLIARAAWSCRGSSPRVRGRQGLSVGADSDHRLIPACAGQTASETSHRAARRAHPRVCGADVDLIEHLKHLPGSSPRVRGRLAVPGDLPPLLRAHPRVCGADASHVPLHKSHAGSSPRVRGRLKKCWTLHCRTRLIPACAGQTRSTECCGPSTTAHPRVCGADSRIIRPPA